MRHRSDIWKKLAVRGRFRMEVKAEIAGVEYTKISAPKIERSLVSDNLSVGNCISSTMQLSILTNRQISSKSPVIIKARLTDGKQYSEYLQFGTYYIDQREYNEGLLTITCYDAMLKASQNYLGDSDISVGWPKTMKAAVAEIAYRIGVSIDPRTQIQTGSDYIVPYPKGLTMLQVLGYIGSCHGGNWIITEDNELRLVPLVSAPDETYNIIDQDYETIVTMQGDNLVWRLKDQTNKEISGLKGSMPSSLIPRTNAIIDALRNHIITSDGYHLIWGADGSVNPVGGLINVPVVIGKITTGENLLISKITMSGEDGKNYSAGNDSGYEVVIDSCPYATQKICNNLYTAFSGLVYAPFEATKTCYDPAAELGDQVKIGDKVCSVLYSSVLILDIDFRADILAPSNKELSREYPFLSDLDRIKSQKYITPNSSYNGVVISELNGLVVRKNALESKVQSRVATQSTDSSVCAEAAFNSNTFSLKGRSAATGLLEDCVYYDDDLGAYHITGDVKIDSADKNALNIEELENKFEETHIDILNLKSSEDQQSAKIQSLETLVNQIQSALASNNQIILSVQEQIVDILKRLSQLEVSTPDV